MPTETPTAQDFVRHARMRAGGPHGIEAELRGRIYDVAPFGDDAVQVLEKDGTVIAILAFLNGAFVVPG